MITVEYSVECDGEGVPNFIEFEDDDLTDEQIDDAVSEMVMGVVNWTWKVISEE